MNDLRTAWDVYVKSEIAWCTPLLAERGYILDEVQTHTLGERYLMLAERDVGGGGRKLILTGTRVEDGLRVIIKVSRDRDGVLEIDREHRARENILRLPFAYRVFTPPEELLHTITHEGCVSISRYITQDSVFIERPIEEQLTLALMMLKLQEAAHASTYEHSRQVRNTFGIERARGYLKNQRKFVRFITSTRDILSELSGPLHRATDILEHSERRIEQYCGFLTHADFVPHNFRIHNGVPYLLDYASLHFGNKYESWARFMNFMMLYNPPLTTHLQKYVVDNRAPEELESLKLMRLYKLTFLLSFYAQSLPQTTGAQRALTLLRLSFWGQGLTALLASEVLSEAVVEVYKRERDTLRDDEEKKRQAQLH